MNGDNGGAMKGVKEAAGILFCLYLILVLAFSYGLLTGESGPYMPFWHWPVKVLAWFAK